MQNTSFSEKLIKVSNLAVKSLSVVGAIILSSQFSVAQEKMNENKIHPAFRRLLFSNTASNTSTNKTNTISTSANNDSNHIKPYKLTPTQGFTSQSATMEERYECIIYTQNAKALIDSGIAVNSVLPTFVTAWVTAKQMAQLSEMTNVTYIDAPRNRRLHNDVARGNSGASLLGAGALNNTKYTGKGVIFGIIDTGIDWDLLDFRDPTDTTKSRILKIWDQTLTATTGETLPTGFTYGVEYTQAQINNEIDGSPAKFVREKDIEGHGTHVAGTAAGNGASLTSKKYMGMAPEADIVVVKGGNGSFSSTHIIDGITYLKNYATAQGKALVLNMSLGGQFSAHDGSEAEEVAVDNFTSSAAGRVAVISAGNDNGTSIHKQISVGPSASGSVAFTVPSSTTISDVFDYLTYVNDNSAVTATVTVPGGAVVTAAAGTSTTTNVLNNAFTVYIDNYIDPSNNNRYVEVYVARNGSTTGNPQGTWTLTLANTTTKTLTIDGWLDDTGDNGTTTLNGGDNNYLVGSPGNAASAITVGAYVGKLSWFSGGANGAYAYSDYTTTENDSIANFSSHGPRRDNVLKPEITAQGQAMVSCLSSDAGISATDPTVVVSGLYLVEQGTSMSSPVVAGCVALLLQANGSATAATIKKKITSTATSDALTVKAGTMPNTTWGYGKIDVYKAAAQLLDSTSQASRKTYQYDNSFNIRQDSTVNLTTQRIAVRFTADITGYMGGFFILPSTTIQPLTVEIRTNNSNVPGTLLGSTVIPVASLGKFSFNYFDLSTLKIPVSTGTDYFIVVYSNGGSAAWSIRRDATQVDNRSLISADAGSTWTLPNMHYRIRPMVYTTGVTSGTGTASGGAVLYHNFLGRGESKNVNVVFTGTTGTLNIFDAIGRKVFTHTLVQGSQSIYVPLFVSGAYFYTIYDTNGKMADGKIIVP